MISSDPHHAIAPHRVASTQPFNELPSAANGTLLVELCLWENDVDAAWRESEALGCNADLLMQLARLREGAHPTDAIRVYQNEIARVLLTTEKRAYRTAVRLLRKVKRAMKRAERATEFPPYVAGLRATHKRRPSFVAMLEASF